MKVLLVGGGPALRFLSHSFVRQGHDVVLVNGDRSECAQLARDLPVEVFYGDGSDVAILHEAGARSADAVLALTPRDQDNLIICQLAKHQFGVGRAIALAHDPENAEAFAALGVSAFSTTPIIAQLIEERAALRQIVNLLPVAEGRVEVTEVTLGSESPAAGHRLESLALPANALVAVVIRGREAIVPGGGCVLEAGDRLVVVTLAESHLQALEVLTGEHP